MAIKVLSSLGHIGCPTLGVRQTSDSSDVEVGAIYACCRSCTASVASALEPAPSATNGLELWPLHAVVVQSSCCPCQPVLGVCYCHAVGLLQPVRDKVGPVHISAALPGRICLSLHDSLLLCTVYGRQHRQRGQESA